MPIRIVQILGHDYTAVGSDMYPEEWSGIRAPAAEQLESDMCPEEWRRLWAATAEQLESDLWPAAWRRLWAATCVFLLQPYVFGRVNLWPRLCSTLMAKRTATLLDVADEREGESAGLGDERGCCSDWLGRSDMREMLPEHMLPSQFGHVQKSGN